MLQITRTYKNFKIVGKTDPRTYFNDSRISEVPRELSNVAEIYYANGEFMQWCSSPQGLTASMRGAEFCIDEYLEPHDDFPLYWSETLQAKVTISED